MGGCLVTTSNGVQLSRVYSASWTWRRHRRVMITLTHQASQGNPWSHWTLSTVRDIHRPDVITGRVTMDTSVVVMLTLLAGRFSVCIYVLWYYQKQMLQLKHDVLEWITLFWALYCVIRHNSFVLSSEQGAIEGPNLTDSSKCVVDNISILIKNVSMCVHIVRYTLYVCMYIKLIYET